MNGASNRMRGARAERDVVTYLRGNGWPDARRYLAGDGRQPGDIDAIIGVTLEVKDRKTPAWPGWVRQAATEAGADRIAAVVRRSRGVRDVGAWPTAVPFPHWVTLVADGTVAGVHPCGIGLQVARPGRIAADIATVLVRAEADQPDREHTVVNLFSTVLDVSVMRFATFVAALKVAGYGEPTVR